jgi:hypothetical protein
MDQYDSQVAVFADLVIDDVLTVRTNCRSHVPLPISNFNRKTIRSKEPVDLLYGSMRSLPVLLDAAWRTQQGAVDLNADGHC